MKKPINKFAVVLWVVALFALLSGVVQYATLLETARWLHEGGDRVYAFEGSALRLISISVSAAAQLAGVGVMIELFDQIRWSVR
ncbi:MAG TPA: hypothetical protein VN154_09780 [Rhizomicrobium sp.]|nr:hypothetical protein [Rhizomicrobium sp.]